jgi:predicted membrane channel-forming protein YqfA (hemolysin III family)
VCVAFVSSFIRLEGCTGHVFNSAACFDYSGVSALICSSIFTMIWYGFYCRPDLLRIYGTVSVVVGVLGLLVGSLSTGVD